MLKDLIGTVNGLIDKMNKDEEDEIKIKKKLYSEQNQRKMAKPPRMDSSQNKMKLQAARSLKNS